LLQDASLSTIKSFVLRAPVPGISYIKPIIILHNHCKAPRLTRQDVVVYSDCGAWSEVRIFGVSTAVLLSSNHSRLVADPDLCHSVLTLANPLPAADDGYGKPPPCYPSTVTKVTSVTVTKHEPAKTITVPGPTVTKVTSVTVTKHEPAKTITVPGPTVTVTKKEPPVTITVTKKEPPVTVTVPGPTVTKHETITKVETKVVTKTKDCYPSTVTVTKTKDCYGY
jgi:hypothetical protein